MSILTKSNSGSTEPTACMTACATASRKAGENRKTPGKWIASLLSASLVLVFVPRARAWDLDVQGTLKGIEERYNHIQTLEVAFSETYKLQGRLRTEQGQLTLRKPGKMRWQYSAPAGKLFVSDGKFVYFYTPQDNRAEKMKFKETDDMRAPLAFLLGRLQFNQDFREFHARPEEGGIFITAIPKSDKLPYTEVSFLASPDFVIHRLEVKGQDGSLLQFTFQNEKKDPPVQDSAFRFAPPPGVEYVDSSNQQ